MTEPTAVDNLARSSPSKSESSEYSDAFAMDGTHGRVTLIRPALQDTVAPLVTRRIPAYGGRAVLGMAWARVSARCSARQLSRRLGAEERERPFSDLPYEATVHFAADLRKRGDHGEATDPFRLLEEGLAATVHPRVRSERRVGDTDPVDRRQSSS